MDMYQVFLEIAQRDLKASKKLLENKFYAQSVFYFQQSVEKGAKSLGLLTNQVEFYQLQGDVGHDALNVFKVILLSQKKQYEEMIGLLKKAPFLAQMRLYQMIDYKSALKGVNDELEHLKEIQNEADNLNYFEERDILESLRIIDNTLFEIREEMKELKKISISKREFEENRDEIQEFIKEICTLNPIYDADGVAEGFTDLFEKNIEKIITGFFEAFRPLLMWGYVTESIYQLGLISLPHSILTRYPEEGFIPQEFYHKKSPIVRLLPARV